ncbi:MAG: hypothetical protein GF381_02180 [Candidatus Pacebacteria bacterium]|nr:hypothetical protein [Candidatus Paceibacterota bacterium]
MHSSWLFWSFVVFGIVFGLFYAGWGNDIFLFAPDKKIEEYLQEKERLKKAPISYKIEAFWHRFIGVFLGWLLLWYLVEIRLDLVDNRNSNPGIIEAFIFIMAWIGMNGRLPSIAHSIVDFLKSGVR